MTAEQLKNWTIDTIRDDDGLGSWLEERKYDWIPLVEVLLQKIISEDSQTIILITDTNTEWFGKYILSRINSAKENRPYLPFIHLKSVWSGIDSIKNQDELNLVVDMLDVMFKQNYTFWYIGSSHNKRAKIAKSREDSFLWVFDEHIHNGFHLSSTDPILDLKLLQLFRLFNKSLSAALFGEITL